MIYAVVTHHKETNLSDSLNMTGSSDSAAPCSAVISTAASDELISSCVAWNRHDSSSSAAKLDLHILLRMKK